MNNKKLIFNLALFVILTILILSINNIFADSGKKRIFFSKIGLAEGLAQVTANSIIQDNKGFLYIATEGGLNKYDGNSIINFSRSSKDGPGLSDNSIVTLYKDSKGIIWIGSKKGFLDRYDPMNNSFSKISLQKSDTYIKNEIRTILEQSSDPDILWLGTLGGGLVRYSKKLGVTNIYRNKKNNPKSLKSNLVYSIIEEPGSKGNILWIATNEGLICFNIKKKEFICIDLKGTGFIGNINEKVRALKFKKDRTLWIGTYGSGLIKMNLSTKNFIRFKSKGISQNELVNNFINVLLFDSYDRLWIGTDGGLSLFEPKKNKFSNYTYNKFALWSLGDNQVISMYEDKSRNIWVGTWNNGINKFDIKPSKFKSIIHAPSNSNSLSFNIVKDIYQDRENNLWIATLNGLDRLNRISGKFIHYNSNRNNRLAISDNAIMDIYSDNRSEIWIGTRNGLNRFDRKSKGFKKYFNHKDDPFSLSSNNIQRIIDDIKNPDRFLWVATRDMGLNRMNKETGHCIHYLHNINDDSTIGDNKVYTLYYHSDNSLWLGTWKGLNLFIPEKKSFKRIHQDPKKEDSISNEMITSITGDPYGDSNILWIGTWGGGLVRYSIRENRVERFTLEDGLSSPLISGIMKDNKKNLWISTTNGISHMNLKTKKITNYTIMMGGRNNAFNAGAYHKNNEGEMFFGGLYGLSYFKPENVIANPFTPKVVLTSFKVFDQEIKPKYFTNKKKEISLNHFDNFFSIEFSGLEYTNPKKNQYAYMLKGFDKIWRITDSNNRSATYMNLDAGLYSFFVKASNNDGKWCEPELLLRIRMIPPFWETILFKVFVSILTLSSIFYFYKLRVRKIKMGNISLQKLVNVQTKDLQNSKEELEKINKIVEVINQSVMLEDVLKNVLNEVHIFKEVEKVGALVFDKPSGFFIFKAAIGTDMSRLKSLKLSLEETEARYIKDAEELHEDIFVIRDLKGRKAEEMMTAFGIPTEMLIIRIKIKEAISGYILFDNMSKKNIFTKENLLLMYKLKNHLVSAFLKSTLLSELETAKKIAIKASNISEAANLSKSDFLARMSHEIRTPLNSVIGFSEMMMNTNLSEEQIDYSKTINLSADMLLSLINDILDFSKIEAGLLDFELIDFDLEVTAFHICDIILPRINTQKIELLCRIGENVPYFANGDPGRFKQVLLNLLGNAIKFTEKGEIELSIEIEEETENKLKILCKVRDTGIGISKNKLDKIFDVFQQAEGSTTRRYGGSGLGLAISKQIANLMDGDVWVQSDKGKGSTFYFNAWLNKSNKKPVREKIIHNLQNQKILIIDDNKNNLDILSNILKQSGVKIITTQDGLQTIPIIEDADLSNEPFNLIIIDIQMPEINGFEIAKEIRNSDKESIKSIPLLAFSSSYAHISKKCIDAGFNAFLSKPIQKRKILEMILYVLGSKNLKNKTSLSTEYTKTENRKHSIRILIAEDNPVNQKLIRYMLTKGGYQLEIVNNGKEVLDAYINTPDIYDLILMDIQMPLMTGEEATLAIRNWEKSRSNKIPIIAMTAQTMKGDKEKFLKLGMNDYISKPIKRELVFQIVKKWCV